MSEPVGNGPRSVIPNNAGQEVGKPKQPAVKEEREKVEKVIQGTARARKLPWYRRAANSFVAEDAQTVGDYILVDILVPAIKTAIRDIIVGGTERTLFGVTGRGGTRGPAYGGLRGNQRSIREKYNEVSTAEAARRSQGGPPAQQRASTFDYKELYFDTRQDAIEVIDSMVSRIALYHEATVKDLYDYCGISGDYTAHGYGWYDLSDANVRQFRGAWLLELPNPVPLRH